MIAAIAAAVLFGFVCPAPTAGGRAIEREGVQQGSDSKRTSTNVDIPVGTTICTELTKAVDAKRAHVGDEVIARVTLPMVVHGQVLLAEGAKVFGRVTEATARADDEPQSHLAMVFDRATLKNGKEIHLRLTVQGVGLGAAQEELLAEARGDNAKPGRASSGLPGAFPPRPEKPAADVPPLLDAGSRGAIGFPDYDFTESKDAEKGSLIASTKKDVKLDSGTQVILRVLTAKP